MWVYATVLMVALTTSDLAEQAASCRACDLWARATQVVFGSGPRSARLLLIGEQPGDEEDRAGAPFVGPAGRLLDEAIEAAHLDRASLYVTNAVKHFKWERRGKRRIHQKPSRTEVVACRPWLDAELAAVDPEVVVTLGATAGQALLGPSFRVGAAHGVDLDVGGRPLIATIHPSAVLRDRNADRRKAAFDGLVADLCRAKAMLQGPP
jgi:uracil-DNA glycosylase family protein